MTNSFPEAKLRLRMSSRDAHYAGKLVDGARILNLFGDLATELTIRYDGDEGLLRAYDQVEFLCSLVVLNNLKLHLLSLRYLQ